MSVARLLALSTLVFSVAANDNVAAQEASPNFSGMWSDLPASPESRFCFVGCVRPAYDYLTDLLDDPDFFDSSYGDLEMMALDRQAELVEAVLTPEGRETYPFDFVANDTSRDCVPWGGALQMFAPHQMQITQYDDRIEILYAEWEALRTIPLRGEFGPNQSGSSLLGQSVGRFEGDSLIIETRGLAPNLLFIGTEASSLSHSDELSITERYEITHDGERLEVAATFQDPVMLREPITIWKPWAWAPEEEIFEYECIVE